MKRFDKDIPHDIRDQQYGGERTLLYKQGS